MAWYLCGYYKCTDMIGKICYYAPSVGDSVLHHITALMPSVLSGRWLEELYFVAERGPVKGTVAEFHQHSWDLHHHRWFVWCSPVPTLCLLSKWICAPWPPFSYVPCSGSMQVLGLSRFAQPWVLVWQRYWENLQAQLSVIAFLLKWLFSFLKKILILGSIDFSIFFFSFRVFCLFWEAKKKKQLVFVSFVTWKWWTKHASCGWSNLFPDR